MAAPVRKRNTKADSGPSDTSGMHALTRAPNRALKAINRCAGIRSAQLSAALARAPTTNPICTDIVIQACIVALRSHSAVNWGITALAENQSDSDRRVAIERSRMLRDLSVMEGTAESPSFR